MPKRSRNVHPGEVLREEFLRPLDISQTSWRSDITVPPRRVNEIVWARER